MFQNLLRTVRLKVFELVCVGVPLISFAAVAFEHCDSPTIAATLLAEQRSVAVSSSQSSESAMREQH